MSLARLFADLSQLGIRVEGRGDRLRISPKAAVSAELLDRLRLHKQEVLAAVQSEDQSLAKCDRCGDFLRELLTFDGFLNLECVACDRCFGCRPSSPEIVERLDKARLNPIPVVQDKAIVGEIVPCQKCGSLEMWRSMAGDLLGRTVGHWRCSTCDPPEVSRRLLASVERIRKYSDRYLGQTQRPNVR